MVVATNAGSSMEVVLINPGLGFVAEVAFRAESSKARLTIIVSSVFKWALS